MSGRKPAKKRRVEEDAVKLVDDADFFGEDEDRSSSSSSSSPSFASPASSEDDDDDDDDDDHLLLSDIDGNNGDGKGSSTFHVPPMDSQDDSMMGMTCSPADLMLGTQPPPKTQTTPPSAASRKHTTTTTSKKRKVSLSPTDSLARGRRTSPRRASSKQQPAPAEEIINVDVDDDQVVKPMMMSMTDILKTPIPRKKNYEAVEQLPPKGDDESRFLAANIQQIKETPTLESTPPQTKQTKRTPPKAAKTSSAPRKVEMVENASMEAAPAMKQSTNQPSTSNGRDNNNNTASAIREDAKKQSGNSIPKPTPAQETKVTSVNQPPKLAPSKQRAKPKASKEEVSTQKRAMTVNEGDAPPKKKKKPTTKTAAPAEDAHATKSPKIQSTSNSAPSKATTSKSTKTTTASKTTAATAPPKSATSKSTKTTVSKDTSSKSKPGSAATAPPSKAGTTSTKKALTDASSKSTKPAPASTSSTTSEETSNNTKPKKKKSKKRTFQDELLHHLFSTCKPYNIKVLAQEMKTNEASVNFCLLSLMDKNWVIKKEFTSKKGGGRSKELYWANHQEGARSKELCDALRMVPPHEMEAGRQELAFLQNQQVTLTNEVTLIFQEPSNEELEAQLQSHETTVQELEQKSQAAIQRIRAVQQQPATTKQPRPLVFGNNSKFQKTAKPKPLCQHRLKKRINEMRGEWKKRKDKCMDFVEQLADGLEKKVKDVVKLLELETDEAEGVKMPPKHIIDR